MHARRTTPAAAAMRRRPRSAPFRFPRRCLLEGTRPRDVVPCDGGNGMEPNVGAARPHWSRWAAVEMTRSADGAGVSDALNEAAAGGSRARAPPPPRSSRRSASPSSPPCSHRATSIMEPPCNRRAPRGRGRRERALARGARARVRQRAGARARGARPRRHSERRSTHSHTTKNVLYVITPHDIPFASSQHVLFKLHSHFCSSVPFWMTCVSLRAAGGGGSRGARFAIAGA